MVGHQAHRPVAQRHVDATRVAAPGRGMIEGVVGINLAGKIQTGIARAVFAPKVR